MSQREGGEGDGAGGAGRRKEQRGTIHVVEVRASANEYSRNLKIRPAAGNNAILKCRIY